MTIWKSAVRPIVAAVLAAGHLLVPWAVAGDLYVSEKGSDTNAGTAADKPLLTLQKADGLAKPGDTVWVMAGTYRNHKKDAAAGTSALLTITHSGTADAPITWRNVGGAKPELIAQGCWQAIDIQASYVVLDGLTLTGNNDNVSQIAAERNAEVDVGATMKAWQAEGSMDAVTDYSATPDQDKPAKSKEPKPAAKPPAKPPAKPAKAKSRPVTYEEASPLFNGNGIVVDSRGSKPFYHHHTIRNCTVRKFGGGGIAIMGTDYYTVENCQVYENAWYSRFGCSGFSQLGGKDFDHAPAYHNYVLNNRVWNNKGLIRVYYLDLFSDGNGMILDSLGDYGGATLVQNNLSYDNGGSGFHVFKSFKARIDVVNNTFWRNQQYWRLFDMGAHAATNVRFLNNIVMADKYRVALGKAEAGITYDYNVYFGGNDTKAIGPHDLVADPMFVRASVNRRDGDFSLRPGSPAIGSGTTELAPKTDLLGDARPVATPSRGAIEPATQPAMPTP